jgi:beta-lactamase class A
MKRSILLVCLSLAIFFLPSSLHAAPYRFIPRIKTAHWQPLTQLADADLQQQLQRSLKSHPLWRRLLDQKKMTVGLVDLADPSGPRFASVNGGSMMYAASLPKIAILLAAFVSFEDGSLPETEEIYDDLNAMIRISSNAAATRMIDRLGFKKIAVVLTDPRYKLFDPARGGGLWVGKRYAKSGARYPDPICGLSHAATADQVCRFYYLLASGKIINPTRSAQMLEILADPMLHHKFVGVLEKRAPGARLFRKSGSWRNWHADSVLVWGGQKRRYILVALVEDSRGEQILRDLVPEVENLVVPGADRPALTRASNAGEFMATRDLRTQ